jgi:hypothetical protein
MELWFENGICYMNCDFCGEIVLVNKNGVPQHLCPKLAEGL